MRSRKNLTYIRENSRVSGNIGVWRTPDRGLIDDNYFVDVRHSLDTVMLPDWEDAFIEIIEKVLGEGVDDEGRLPRS